MQKIIKVACIAIWALLGCILSFLFCLLFHWMLLSASLTEGELKEIMSDVQRDIEQYAKAQGHLPESLEILYPFGSGNQAACQAVFSRIGHNPCSFPQTEFEYRPIDARHYELCLQLYTVKTDTGISYHRDRICTKRITPE